jgi:hypothetical protein
MGILSICIMNLGEGRRCIFNDAFLDISRTNKNREMEDALVGRPEAIDSS